MAQETNTGAAADTEGATATEATAAAAAAGAADQAKTVVAGQTASQASFRDGLEGEQLEFASRFTSAKDLVQAGLDLRKANSSMIRVPGVDAKPEDIAKFHKAIGVPDKAEDYKFDLGREQTEADQAVIAKVGEVFLAYAVPAAAATAVSKAVAELAQAQIAEANRVALQHREAAQTLLNKEWGADRERNMQVALRAVEVFGGEELRTYLNDTIVNGQKLGDHPVLAKAFARIGMRMGEGDFIGAANAGERVTAQDRINQIMAANPPGTDSYKSPAIQRELRELNEKLSGAAPIVGAAGRTA